MIDKETVKKQVDFKDCVEEMVIGASFQKKW